MQATHERATHPTARQVHDDIEGMLGRSPAAHTWSGRVGRSAKKNGQRAWHTMKRYPFLSVAAMAIGATALASVVGVVELTFGCAVAYATYKVLREGEPPLRAVQEVERELIR
jgi:hypothetical protein